jgi:RNA polymerase sigma-70 factor (ECF subfamily)
MADLADLDDRTLVGQARRSQDAFAALYRRYLARLYNYLNRRVSDCGEAEDITAQVFIEVLEGLVSNQYQENGCFAAWLFTIARRRLADFYRQRPASVLYDPPSAEPGLLSMIEKGQDLQRLSSLLSQLDEDRQELLRLRFSAGLSFAEISALDGRNEAAVKMTLYRTLDFLREHWEAENE